MFNKNEELEKDSEVDSLFEEGEEENEESKEEDQEESDKEESEENEEVEIEEVVEEEESKIPAWARAPGVKPTKEEEAIFLSNLEVKPVKVNRKEDSELPSFMQA